MRQPSDEFHAVETPDRDGFGSFLVAIVFRNTYRGHAHTQTQALGKAPEGKLNGLESPTQLHDSKCHYVVLQAKSDSCQASGQLRSD